MSEFDFIIDGIRFSYSSVSTYHTCPHCFKLSYIDLVPKTNNFFSEYGLVIHEVMEKYFRDELDMFDMTQAYIKFYKEMVVSPPPIFLKNLEERYYNEGLEFFNNFSFNKEDFEVLLIEGRLDFLLAENRNISFTGRPDLVLKNKQSGKISLYDYKSSSPFRIDKRSGKEIVDKKKLEGYSKQMFIYAYGLRKEMGILLDDITLWFTRPSRFWVIPWSQEEEDKSMQWLYDTIDELSLDDKFLPDISSPFFCDNLCSVSQYCEYR